MYFLALKVTWKTRYQILKYFYQTTLYIEKTCRNRQGGGVFIAVRTDIPSCDVNIASSLEIIWVQPHTISSSDVILGCFYRPPHLPSSVLDNSVETGSGHPGHIFSGSSGSDPVYNLSGSDPDWVT